MIKTATTFDEVKKSSSRTVTAILKKQCDMIKVNLKTFRFVDGWQSSRSWTVNQQNKFKKWFINYLYGNLKRTREVSSCPHMVYKSKKRISETWSWWNLNYGWKVNGYKS